MTINELQKAIEEYLSLDNTSENDNVCFFIRGDKYVIHYPIDDYGFSKDHLNLYCLITSKYHVND